MTRDEFIAEHIKVCSKTGSKRYPRRPGTPHRGRGAYISRSEAQRKRSCASSLWKWCHKIGVAPVMHWNDLTDEQKPKGWGGETEGV